MSGRMNVGERVTRQTWQVELANSYVNYDDPEANVEDLIGGISVADRVDSITEKCSQLLASY